MCTIWSLDWQAGLYSCLVDIVSAVYMSIYMPVTFHLSHISPALHVSHQMNTFFFRRYHMQCWLLVSSNFILHIRWFFSSAYHEWTNLSLIPKNQWDSPCQRLHIFSPRSLLSLGLHVKVGLDLLLWQETGPVKTAWEGFAGKGRLCNMLMHAANVRCQTLDQCCCLPC